LIGKRERIESVESFITNVFDGPINEAHHLEKEKEKTKFWRNHN
jgi:hypothetical protein